MNPQRIGAIAAQLPRGERREYIIEKVVELNLWTGVNQELADAAMLAMVRVENPTRCDCGACNYIRRRT